MAASVGYLRALHKFAPCRPIQPEGGRPPCAASPPLRSRARIRESPDALTMTLSSFLRKREPRLGLSFRGNDDRGSFGGNRRARLAWCPNALGCQGYNRSQPLGKGLSGGRPVQGHRSTYQRLEGIPIYFIALMQIDGTPDRAFKAGVEQT
jgi:hypothetical protein